MHLGFGQGPIPNSIVVDLPGEGALIVHLTDAHDEVVCVAVGVLAKRGEDGSVPCRERGHPRSIDVDGRGIVLIHHGHEAPLREFVAGPAGVPLMVVAVFLEVQAVGPDAKSRARIRSVCPVDGTVNGVNDAVMVVAEILKTGAGRKGNVDRVLYPDGIGKRAGDLRQQSAHDQSPSTETNGVGLAETVRSRHGVVQDGGVA